MVEVLYGMFGLADSFKLAGDLLVDAVGHTTEAYDIARPIIYNYRHALELYMKTVLDPKYRSHNLKPLLDKLRLYLKNMYNKDIPIWIEDTILELNKVDEGAAAFRYGNPQVEEESWHDLYLLKERIGWIAESFQRIRRAEIEYPESSKQ
jgi:hypothetical protein